MCQDLTKPKQKEKKKTATLVLEEGFFSVPHFLRGRREGESVERERG